MRETDRGRLFFMVDAAAFAVGGLAWHNWSELRLGFFAWENWAPAAVTTALLLAWIFTGARPVAGAIMGVQIVHVLAAIVTVLPLPFLPFAPEQDWQHYATHFVYGVLQLPLFAMARSAYRRSAA